MRAIWWMLISFGIFKVFPDLADQANAYNRDTGSAVFGVGFALFVFIWTLILAQATFTRINRTIGYVLFNIGFAFTIFLALGTAGLFLSVLIAAAYDNTPVRLIILAGVLIAAAWLLWMIVTLVRRKQSDSFVWRILETNKLVGADPARMQTQSAPAYDYDFDEPAEDTSQPNIFI